MSPAGGLELAFALKFEIGEVGHPESLGSDVSAYSRSDRRRLEALKSFRRRLGGTLYDGI